jgi:hypothetical protein
MKSIFDYKPKPPSNDPHDWVYEATYKDDCKTVSFKFNPLEGVDPLKSARNMVFQEYKDQCGAVSGSRYTTYLNAQASLSVRRHHQIED